MPKHSGQKWSSGGLTASRGAPRFPLTPFTLRPHPHLSTLQAHPTKQFPVLGWLWDPSSRNPWPWAARAPRFPGVTWLPRREQMHPPPKLTDRGMATWKAMEIIPAKMKGTQPSRREQRRHPGPLALPSSQHPLGRDLRPRGERGTPWRPPRRGRISLSRSFSKWVACPQEKLEGGWGWFVCLLTRRGRAGTGGDGSLQQGRHCPGREGCCHSSEPVAPGQRGRGQHYLQGRRRRRGQARGRRATHSLGARGWPYTSKRAEWVAGWGQVADL